MKLILLTILMACSVSGQAAVYFVNGSNGSDTNAGTDLSQPWKTIQRASNKMVAGDTVLVLPGIYEEMVKTISPGPITFKSVCPCSVTNRGFWIRHPNITVDGFDMTGPAGIGYKAAWWVQAGGRGASLVNSRIRDLSKNYGGLLLQDAECVASNNLISNPGYHMLVIGGSSNLITANLFNGSGGYDGMRIFGSSHVIRANTFTNISGIPGTGGHPDLFQTFGSSTNSVASDILIERNLFINCDSQICQLNQMGAPEIRDWTIRNNVFARISWAANVLIPGAKWHNNTFYACTRNTGMVLIFGAGEKTKSFAHRGEVKNNIFYECGSHPDWPSKGWYGAANVLDFQADYNYVGGINGAPKILEEEHGINGGDPGFVSIQENDFRLLPDSILIDKGVRLPGFTNDLTGVARGELWDIGAYEEKQ